MDHRNTSAHFIDINNSNSVFNVNNYPLSSLDEENNCMTRSINYDNLPSSQLSHYDQNNHYVNNNQALQTLLKEWNLEILYQTCIDQLVDINILQIIKFEHANELLALFPIGTKVLFIHELEKWQKKNKLLINESEDINTKSLNQNDITKNSINSQKTSINLDLAEILNSSTQGNMITNYFKSNNKLNDSIRTMLVDLIINYVITTKISMSVNVAETIAVQIETLFPTEVKDTYFLRGGLNKSPKGKLYAKYYNSMRLLKTSGLVTDKKETMVQTKTQRQFEPEKDIQHILDELFYDSDITFPNMQNLWKATTQFRLDDIQKSSSTEAIMLKWKQYKVPLGFKLIDIDFNALYPQLNCDVVSSFNEKAEKFLKLFEIKIKDPSSRALFEQMKNTQDINENAKNTVVFCLFHAVLVPTSKKVTRDENGKKSQIKYSIKDSVNSFIVFKNSAVEVEEYMLTRKNENQPIQPFLIVIGTPLNPKEFFIFFDCIKYKIFSITSAVDTCFKIFHLFNLEYPTQSSNVWLFIQKYFYSLSTKYDKPYHCLGQVLSDLNSL